jgi:acetylornithine/N-succinyldiaminopimelate aminotransferase
MFDKKTNKYYHEKDQEHYLQTFKRYPLAIEKGRGARVWDVEGNEYIDVLAGIAVCSVGHSHPDLAQAICEQAYRLMHISNFYVSKPQVELSEELTKLSGLDRVFLTNSGAESVEGAIKIGRKYAHSKGRGGTVLSMDNCFHGRTMATIATGKKKMQEGFDPIPQGFKQVEAFNDIDELRAAINDDVGVVIVEPIQGEGGINVADKDFLMALREICTEKKVALVFDEVQAGVGRTGKWFAKDLFGVQPDIMTLAKGLGGGFPVGAVLSNQKTSDAINFGDHGTTFGGNPLACAAALAVIKIIKKEKLGLFQI